MCVSQHVSVPARRDEGAKTLVLLLGARVFPSLCKLTFLSETLGPRSEGTARLRRACEGIGVSYDLGADEKKVSS